MHSIFRLAAIIAASFLVFSYLPSGAAVPSQQSGFDVRNLDPTCPACRDFWQHATGGWRSRNPIPAAYPSWDRFEEINDRTVAILHAILERDAAAPANDAEARKIGRFYSTCMNTSQIERDGLRPLAPSFGAIAALDGRASIPPLLVRLHRIGVDAFFGFSSTPDQKHSTRVIGEFDQGGLGLPNRDYYFDATSATIRAAYRRHVTKMFMLSGETVTQSVRDANAVMRTETTLARTSLTNVALRDPVTTYHLRTLAQIKAIAPALSWQRYVVLSGVSRNAVLNAAEPAFLHTVSVELQRAPIADLRAYLRWRVLDSFATALPRRFVDENFAFNGRLLNGTKAQLPRWKRCITAENGVLGEAVGKAYVAQTFPPAAKARALALVNNLQATLHDDIASLPWMTPATRRYANYKLAAYVKKIGYPAKWRDYSAYRLTDSYAGDVARGRAFETHRDLAKIGKPVDRGEWADTPQTVNAYYDTSLNEIVFPAAILSPPFFDAHADDAANYGAIGAIIGHEMTHGFDDEGHKYDASGNLRNWWRPADLRRFEARATCVTQQFNASYVIDHVHENGPLVTGEAIADLGGLTIAYRAFERTLRGKPHTLVDGLTPDQRFFLAFGNVWAANQRPQYVRLLQRVDPHPAPQLRVDNTLRNTAAFARAFSCPVRSAMVRPQADRCVIW